MTSYHRGVLITNTVAGVVAASVAVFTAAFAYILVRTLVNTPFNLSLSTGASSMAESFFVYGFISIEACFVAVVLYFGYSTVRNALKRKVIEIEVD
jgi:hypothetical protein